MYKRTILFLICLLSVVCVASSATFRLTDGNTMTGDFVSMDETGFILKMSDGSYSQRTAWNKLAQDDLKELLQNPKAAQFAQPFIVQSQEEKMKKTEIEIKDFPHLPRAQKGSLIGAMFTSSMGLFLVVLFVGANAYAGYEIALFRGHPVVMVAGLSALVPILAPIIFICISKPLKSSLKELHGHKDEAAAEIAAIAAADAAVAEVAQAEASGHQEAAAQADVPKHPPARKFSRGQFTFNRRFFETQLPAYFPVVRPEAERDNLLSVKSTRGAFIAQRIVRISANEVTFQVVHGSASEDVITPFLEIQEVVVRHKDAPES